MKHLLWIGILLIVGACSTTAPDTLTQFQEAGFHCVSLSDGWHCTKCDRINPRAPNDKLFSKQIYCEAYTFSYWTQ